MNDPRKTSDGETFRPPAMNMVNNLFMDLHEIAQEDIEMMPEIRHRFFS